MLFTQHKHPFPSVQLTNVLQEVRNLHNASTCQVCVLEHVWQFTQVHATFSIGIMLQRDIMHKWFPNSWVINSNLYLGGRYTRPVNGLEIKALWCVYCWSNRFSWLVSVARQQSVIWHLTWLLCFDSTVAATKKHIFYITVLCLMDKWIIKVWVMFHISCFIHNNRHTYKESFSDHNLCGYFHGSNH